MIYKLMYLLMETFRDVTDGRKRGEPQPLAG